MSIKVQCVTHIGTRDANGHITGIGGIQNGNNWHLSEAEAIAGIKAGKWEFYVQSGLAMARVIIASRNGHEFLKTEADSTTKDNLLSLPPCPR